MFHSRVAEATLIGCLAALASFCALSARAGETYSVVAQSTRSSAATGRRPLSERIAAANLPIITQAAAAPPQEAFQQSVARDAAVRAEATASAENMAVAAVRVEEHVQVAPEPPPVATPPVLWPFGPKWTPTVAQRSSPSKQPSSTAKETAALKKQPTPGSKGPATGREVPRQANARSSGKGLSSSSPASVTR